MFFRIVSCLVLVNLYSYSIGQSYSLDSLIFADNGQYILETTSDYTSLNGCQCKYWKLYRKDSFHELFYVIFNDDSLSLVKYLDDSISNLRLFKVNNCGTFARLIKSEKVSKFLNEYNLRLGSIVSNDSIVFNFDTISSRKIQYFEKDSTLVYLMRVNAKRGELLLFQEDFETPNPSRIKLTKKQISYSKGSSYYFLSGGIEYLVEVFKNEVTFGESIGFLEIKKIGTLSLE